MSTQITIFLGGTDVNCFSRTHQDVTYIIFLILFQMIQMEGNPWQVHSIQAFSYLKCPECTFDTQEEEKFENHASENHPLSFVFFGTTFIKEENVNLDESYSEDYKDPLTINGEIKSQSDTTHSENLALSFPNLSNIKEEDNFEKLPNVNKEDFYTANDLEEDGYMTKKCPECDFFTPNPKKYIIHIRKVHNIKKKTGEKNEICNVCNKAFNRKSRLKLHIESVHENKRGEKTNICHNCNKAFAETTKLKLHIESVHEKLKPFLCPHCGSRYSRKPILKLHIERIHDKTERIGCSICSKTFSHVSYLKKHTETIHEGKKPHMCSECGKSFAQLTHLKIHVSTVHERNKFHKAHMCSNCGKSFTALATLNLHISTVHEGKKDYKCTLCEYTTGYSASLKTHVNAVHERNKDHICSTCGASFVLKTRLQRHIRAVHDKTEKVICPICSKTFTQVTYLKAHTKTVHEGKKYIRKEK